MSSLAPVGFCLVSLYSVELNTLQNYPHLLYRISILCIHHIIHCHFHCLARRLSITSLSLYCATDDESCIAIEMFGTNYIVQSRAIEVLHQADHTVLYC